MVEPAGRAIEYIRVAEAAEAPDLIDEAIAGEREDRVFLGVGVEVADQQCVVAARHRLPLRRVAAQAVGLLGAQQVPAALAVAGVVVARVVGGTRAGATALALEVVDEQREALAIGKAEGLRQRRAVVDRVGVAVGSARGAQPGRLVDDGGADGVSAGASMLVVMVIILMYCF